MRKARLLKRLESFSQKRKALLNQLSGLSHEELTTPPSENQWSLLEIIEHLVRSEQYVFKNCPDPKELTPQRRGIQNYLLYSVVILVLRSKRLKVDVPAARMRPTGEQPLGELINQWNANEEWLFAYVNSLDSKTVNAPVFLHPVSGPVTPKQAIYMLHIHFDKHMRQIQGILNSSSTSGTLTPLS